MPSPHPYLNNKPREYGEVTLEQAVKLGRLVTLDYSGSSRKVEVHAIGISTQGNIVFRCFQLEGGSVSGKPDNCWKLMDLAKATNIKLTTEASQAPRPGYSPDDKGMIQVIAQVA